MPARTARNAYQAAMPSRSNAVRERVIWAATELLLKAGCQVTETRAGHTVTLAVYNPPDSPDPHGDRLRELLDAQAT